MSDNFFAKYPVQGGGGGGVATYPNLASFPASAPDGTLAIALDTGYIYEFRTTDNMWHLVAGPDIITGAPNTFAGFDAAGLINEIPGWSFSPDTFGAQVALTVDPSVTGSININQLEIEVSPSADTATTITSWDFNTHYDRSNQGFNFTNVLDTVNINLSHEGDGNVNFMRALNIDAAIGSGSSPSTATTLHGQEITLGIRAGAEVTGQMTGFQLNVNRQGTHSGDLNGIVINPDNGTSNSYSGINMNYQGNTTLSLSHLTMNGSGTYGEDYNFLSGNNTGNIGRNYSGIAVFNQGTVADNYLGINMGNQGDIVGNHTSINLYNDNPAGGNINGIIFNNTADSGADTNMLTLAHTGDVAENFNGIQINATGVATLGATGININMGSLTTPANNGHKSALTINGGSLNTFYTYDGTPSIGFEFGNQIVSAVTVQSGTPIDTEEFVNGFIGQLYANDDATVGPLGLGVSMVGLLGNLSVTSGKTVDFVNLMAAGGSLPGTSTGGTINDLAIYRSFGIFSQGGTAIINNVYGLHLGPTFSSSGTNTYSLYSADVNTALVNEGDATLGSATLNNTTALTVPYLDAAKKLVSSVVTNIELGYVSGVTSSIQTQLNGKMSSALTSAHIFVGNGSNVATDVAVSGDATLANTGALTLKTVNADVGNFGSTSSVAGIIVNGKGLITAAGNIGIQIAESQVTNLVSDLAGKQPVGNYITALTGDATATGPGSVALTLATVNGNVGTFGSATQVPVLTVNAKGLITAVSNTSIAIPFSQVSGTVPLNQGGTGQTTKAAAFDALSPMSAGGDIIYGGASGTGTRLANGSAGQFLKSQGTTLAPIWANSTATPSLNYTAKTSAYTAVAGDLVDCTSGTFVVTLPTAASIAGQSIQINNSGTGVITVNTTSAQTVAGLASGAIKMGTTFDTLTVASDGTNWLITINGIYWGITATNTSGQSIPNNTSTTITGWTTEFDPNSTFNASTGIFTAVMPGMYQMNIYTAFSLAGVPIINSLYGPSGSKNAGALVKSLGLNTLQVAGLTAVLGMDGAAQFRLAAGDTLRFTIFQNSSASQALSTATHCEINRVGN